VLVVLGMSLVETALLALDWYVVDGAIPSLVYLFISGLSIFFARGSNTYLVAGFGTLFQLWKVYQLIVRPTLQLDEFAPLTVSLHVGLSIFSLWLIARLVSVRQNRIRSLNQMNQELAEANKQREQSQRLLSESVVKLERSNQELDSFVRAASHDLKSPLRAIDKTSQWLEEDLTGRIDPSILENLTLLRRRVTRMERFLDDLRDYARIGDADNGSSREMVNGDQLMSDITLLTAPPEGFEIVWSETFKSITLRRMPIQQILLNLISNAIKHHHKSDGRVLIDLDTSGADYLFTVSDDGPGIDKAFHDRIFRLFETLRRRDIVEGSGLGLAIVKKHLDTAGGQIWIDASDEAGSKFCFTWPRPENSRQA
tara:strand:- start:33319 stop:34425 length:1107 start_codon:yes stop_codon:yes gene_type:complete